MSTIARNFAEYSLGLAYTDLPSEVVHQAKRIMLDTLGCAIGGYPSQASNILRNVIPGFKGITESTIMGDGTKTSCQYAAMVNGTMTRYLDYNETYHSPGPVLSGGHFSEMLLPILAVGERQKSKGKDIIAAFVAGWEISARFADACSMNRSLEQRGWNAELKGGFIVPASVGKLLGMNADQIENAIGIAGSHTMLLGILDAPKEEYTMAKNIRFPWTAHNGILASLLAQQGFTGPTRVIEGQWGFIDTILHGEFDFAKGADFTGFKIMKTAFKPFVADHTTHGHLTATLQLVKEHNIMPEDVAEIRVHATTRNVEHTGQPVKRYPKNKETADHSSYYLTAIAILDRQVGPDQFCREKFEDPRVRELIDKMTFEVDKELDKLNFFAGSSEIITKQGASYKHQVTYPKGHSHNPMTDAELEEKFSNMASKYMGTAQIKQIFKTIYGMERLDNIGELMKLMVFNNN